MYLISYNNTITAKSRGGFWGGLGKADGTLTCYTGYIIGVNYGSASNLISFGHASGKINNYFEDAHDHPSHKSYSGLIAGRSDSTITNGYSLAGDCSLVGNDGNMIEASSDTNSIINSTKSWSIYKNNKFALNWM